MFQIILNLCFTQILTRIANLPKMYIIVKQLSKAKPTRKRHRLNCQKFVTKAVATPATKPIKLQPAKAGIRP